MLARACSLAVLALLSIAASAQAGPFDTEYGPGFSAEVGGSASVECNVLKGKLECRNYAGELPAGASCSFGGAVATVGFRRSGSARKSSVCMDEGFHGWKVLRRGRTFRSGSFRCTHRRRLTCSNTSHRFSIDSGGRVVRTAQSSATAASAATCYDRGYEDLIARNIRCATAERVYRRSLEVASANSGGRTRFRLAGLRWTCRAHNPPTVEFYTWRCTAGKGRLSQYRWKSGE